MTSKSNQEVQRLNDNLRRYRAIRQALKQCYPGESSGQMARHLCNVGYFG